MHLDHDNCLEAVLLKGPSSDVEAFGDSVMSRPGIHHGRLHRIPVPRTDDSQPHAHPHPDRHSHD
jgi:CopG family nickel-responsive transcriptional regulator